MAACSCLVLCENMAGDLFYWPCALVLVMFGESTWLVMCFLLSCALLSIVYPLLSCNLIPVHFPHLSSPITCLVCSLFIAPVLSVLCWIVCLMLPLVSSQSQVKSKKHVLCKRSLSLQ